MPVTLKEESVWGWKNYSRCKKSKMCLQIRFVIFVLKVTMFPAFHSCVIIFNIYSTHLRVHTKHQDREKSGQCDTFSWNSSPRSRLILPSNFIWEEKNRAQGKRRQLHNHRPHRGAHTHTHTWIMRVLFKAHTLSSKNLLWPSEERVILWEPTKEKLLERLGSREDEGPAVVKETTRTN